jgi:hypothetical protein
VRRPSGRKIVSYDHAVADVVAGRIETSKRRINAKRLPPGQSCGRL